MLDQKVGGKLLSRKGFLRSSRGMSYVEVLVALTVMSIIVLLVPAAMLHSTKAMNTIEEKTVAESLTRTQIEYLKSIAYKAVPNESEQGTNTYGDIAKVLPPDASYVIDIAVVAVDPDTDLNTYGRYQELVLTETQKDAGIQEITVKVKHIDRPILTTIFYKVSR